jgi:phenylalanyl-tRNA synthetase beta chain
MRVVWSWLLELCALEHPLEAAEGADRLTAAGLEVEGLERLGGDFDGVVVAEVVAARPHPGADSLTLVEVIDRAGGGATEVVCGAPNVPAPGGRVLWARPGATLPGGMAIATRAIRGVESAGMLCSERELGAGDDADGIVVLDAGDPGATLGAPAQAALGLPDAVLDISVPANRPDCLGHLGVARELAALCRGRLALPPVELAELTDAALAAEALVAVHIDDADACPRYSARVIDGVTVGPSPRWMQQRLRAVGVRPISNLVDVTNYVMFELGQPLHAFDFSRLTGARIAVRRAAAGERLVTLDEVERTLTPEDLLICDDGGPVALAGVMGGASTEVSGDTRRVLLECASFAPGVIRRAARRLGLHSEASHRFERGVDPELPALASARAARLIAELCGGRVAGGVVDAYVAPAKPRTVTIRASRASALTGVRLPRARIATLLGSLGLRVVPADDDDVLAVECPTFRTDLTREVDLIEEVLRLHGFDQVPTTLASTEAAPSGGGDPRGALARQALTAAGYSEAITFGFTSPARIAALRLAPGDRRAAPVALQNPMTVEQSVMRTSLLPNLLAALARNASFGVEDVALFEIGSVFLARGAGELPDEPSCVAGVLCGRRPGWLGPGDEVDFYDAKGAVERLLAALIGADRAATFAATDQVPYMHPGVCATIALPDGTVVGEVGEIHPETRRALGVEARCFGFHLQLGALPAPGPAQMRPVPRFPAVTRDLSFFVDEGVPAARVSELIAGAAEPLVERVTVLEDYRDPAHVPAGKKGMLWSITYRAPDRTLTDAEVDAAHEAIVAGLLAGLPAERR